MKEIMEGGTTDREKVIVRTSIIGIAANVVLAGFKAVVGISVNSIAVVLDAVNNLSDALSSMVTIIGTKLAAKKPDKKHPFGYGRIEYLSQLIVAAIVLYAGITAFTESAGKIFSPEKADYSAASLVIIASAIVVKLILGAYVKKKGRETNSGALVASGEDASFDAILSGSVLVCAVIYLISGIGLEPYVGIVIAVMIVKSGIEMIKDAVNEMLGARTESDFSKEIKKTVAEEDGVRGVYDLILHNYGPDRFQGSCHIEVDDTVTARELDVMTRHIMERVYREHGVIMAAVGVYAHNTGSDSTAQLQEELRRFVMSHEGVLQIHGIYVNIEDKKLSFDVIIDFAVEERREHYKKLCAEVKEKYPGYDVLITLDNDYSD